MTNLLLVLERALFLSDNNGYLYTAVKGMSIVSKPRQMLDKLYYYNGGITSFHSSQLKFDSFFLRMGS